MNSVQCAALVIIAALSTPMAFADTTYRQAVANCFADNPRSQENCFEVVNSQCANQSEGVALNACRHELSQNWLKDLKPEMSRFIHDDGIWDHIEMRIRIGRTEVLCQSPKLPDTARIGKYPSFACNTLIKAAMQHIYAFQAEDLQQARKDYLVEVNALVSCTLESGVAGHAQDCIRLFRDTCNARAPRDPHACAAREITQWRHVHSELGFPKEATRTLWDRFISQSADCTRLPDSTECMLDTYAQMVITAVEDQ